MSEDYDHSNVVSRCLRAVFGSKQSETVREAIEDLIEEANSNGEEQLSKHEQLLLNNILSLQDKKCYNVMIPRADIIAFNKDGSVAELAELMINQGHSRIPIYGENLDDILGIIHIIDLASLLLQNKEDTKVKDVIYREIKLVSSETSVLDLLRDMQSNKIHMALVINEYGGIDGLITIEDLLEEIVGDIEDEYDIEEEPEITVLEDSIIADSRAELDKISELTGINFQEDPENEDFEIDTIGGYVFHLAERVPNREEIIKGNNNVKFQILESDPRRIKKIKIILPKEQPKEKNDK